MRRAKIADAQTQRRDYRLRRHRFALAISILSLFNASSMPLAAYLSEYLPWRGFFSTPETYANYTEFNTVYLATNQRRYSNATLPTGVIYVADAAKNTQVTRTLLRLHQPPMDTNACLSKLLLGLPGLMYYSEPQVELLCSTFTSNATSDARGSCYASHLCSFMFGRSCLWLVPGDAISSPYANMEKDATLTTLYFVSEAIRDPEIVWYMFIYRIGTTLFVWSRLWSRYYRHCAQLESLVRRCGHRVVMPSGTWTYELVYEMQVQDSTNPMSLLLGMMYLARSVWFAYWGLCLVSLGLKALRKEHRFSEVDPALIAIAVALYGPIMAYMNGHVLIFVRVSQWLFYCLTPHERQRQEAALMCIFITLLTLSAPLIYGVVAGCTHCRQRRDVDYSASAFNNLKSAFVLRFASVLRRVPQLPPRGGFIYHLLETAPQLKRCPTISLRGTDCFLVCYLNGKLHERLRLSLLTNVDVAKLPRSNEATDFVVHELHPATSKNIAIGPSLDSSFELRTPPEPTLWCI
ncbi:hypothetical protein SDRG_17111 [Saprolegnia diclina VS20]|uniref:Uncharacterized protein n=1 Tax=Saprolegnia diclina (strain VS20) TaxID=1156394 RepID=T0PS06_SAPDV|nr:hypothetical protein SDRG_17111 [Saprolegnia diclina VS20]EQC24991.1 hypothetical protein SDRG_17111 [Saprolegnia diclina VS20]|eukprot:XP_008621568.1 hypothetical protein SDRG_17111 [Saprolegnia diclina VS20]